MKVLIAMLKSEHGRTIILNSWRGVEIAEAGSNARRNEIIHNTDLMDP